MAITFERAFHTSDQVPVNKKGIWLKAVSTHMIQRQEAVQLNVTLAGSLPGGFCLCKNPVPYLTGHGTILKQISQ